MRDENKNFGRDPRYLDLVAVIILAAFVGMSLILINRGFTIEPIRTAGVDQYVRW